MLVARCGRLQDLLEDRIVIESEVSSRKGYPQLLQEILHSICLHVTSVFIFVLVLDFLIHMVAIEAAVNNKVK